MPLTPEERKKLEEFLGKLEGNKRSKILASFEAFVNWLRTELNSIYLKIKDMIQQIWIWLKEAFS